MKIEEKISLYLNEGRSKSVTIDFARNFINKKCQDAIKGTSIFRGIDDYTDDYLYIDPSKSQERLSPYAEYNYYNLLLSSLPSWNKYPPRNKSIICTTSYYNAEHRQDGDFPFRVFPVDGSKIGVCNEGDIWEGFRTTVYASMQSFNILMYEFFDINGVNTRRTDTSLSAFIKACAQIDKIRDNEGVGVPNFGKKDWLQSFADDESKPRFFDYIDDLLSPDNNYFKLVKSGAKIPNEREVWTDGESILIRSDSDLYTEIFGKDWH